MNRTARLAIFLSGCTVFAAGCGSMDAARDLGPYRSALAATDPAGVVQPDAAVREAAVARFIGFYRVYSAEVIRKSIRDVYAEDAYFVDPFHEMSGVDVMETYFLRAAEPIQECTFDIVDWAEHNGEYYFRWIMRLTLKDRGGETPTETPGLTHVRFNADGKVIFHADYWDPQYPVYDKIPVVSGLLRYVRGRITGD